jgi:MoaA/NifB/PqqE/SkfB family radical SAM enzyme
LIFSTWYREPDYAANYRQLYELERELSDELSRFELLSVWRLARDETYAGWARDIGTAACQLTFYGLEETTDWFVRRRGAFGDNLKATERLLQAGIRPRWQLVFTRPLLAELDALVDLVRELDLERRVDALGGFDVFLNSPSPEGEAFHIEHLRPEVGAYELLPEYLVEKTQQHFGKDSLHACLGRPEGELVAELLRCDEPAALAPGRVAFMVTSDLDVYSNIAELTPWWRLGNLAVDGLDHVLARHEENMPVGYRANYAVPVARLAETYGRSKGRRLYLRSDLVRRWLHLWGREHSAR